MRARLATDDAFPAIGGGAESGMGNRLPADSVARLVAESSAGEPVFPNGLTPASARSAFATALPNGEGLLEGAYLRWPAVRSCDAAEETLFRLAEPVLLARDGIAPIDEDFVRKVERAGFIDEFELRVAEAVIAWLDRYPLATLGLPLLASGLGRRSAWSFISTRLSQRRDIAVRLTIDLRFQGNAPEVGIVAAFTEKCRELGCQICLSGFGDCDLSLAHIMAASASLIRISPSFAHRASASRNARDVLAHCVAMIDGIARHPAAVIDGVDDPETAAVARDCGARWIAGRYCGVALRGFAPVQPITGRMRYI